MKIFIVKTIKIYIIDIENLGTPTARAFEGYINLKIGWKNSIKLIILI